MRFSQRMAMRAAAAVAVGTLFGAGCANPFRTPPADALVRAQERAAAATSVRTKTNATLQFDTPKQIGTERLTLTMTSESADAYAASGDARAMGSTTLVADAVEFSARVAWDQRAIGTVAYLKVTDLALTPTGEAAAQSQAQSDLIVNAVKGVLGGRWVTIDSAEMQALAAQFGAKNTSMPSNVAAFQMAVRDALRAHPVLVFRADLGSDRVGSTKAYHYRVGLNRAAIDALVTAIAPAASVTVEDIAKFRLGLNHPDIVRAIDASEGEAWIAKRGGDLLRIRFPVDLSNFPNTGAATGMIDVTYADWGKVFTVAAPTPVKTIQEILDGFLPLLTASAP